MDCMFSAQPVMDPFTGLEVAETVPISQEVRRRSDKALFCCIVCQHDACLLCRWETRVDENRQVAAQLKPLRQHAQSHSRLLWTHLMRRLL